MHRSMLLLLAAGVAIPLAAQTTSAASKPASAKTAAKPAPKPPTVPVETPKPAFKAVKIGDPAPAFKVGRWVKHGPIAELKKGQVYVVEFWATWCPPCKDSIPHLTELAKKYGEKVSFIGVDIWERPKPGENIDATVDAFVKEFGAKMDYNVVRDTADQHMTNAWMKAANQRGIPAAFIVDKTGTIAFIGNPHPGSKTFEESLEKIVAGNWDVKAAAAQAEKEAAEEKAEEEKAQARQKATQEVMPAIQDAIKAKDWAKVLQLADAAEAKHADLKTTLKRPRFLALAATDVPKAQALLDVDLAKNNVAVYMNTASLLLSDRSLDKRWAEQALACIDKAVALDAKLAPRVASIRFDAIVRTDLPKAKTLFAEAKGKGTAKDLAASFIEAEGLDKASLEEAVGVLTEAQTDPKAHPVLNQGIASGYAKLGQPAKAAEAQAKWIAFLKGAQGVPPQMLAEAEEALRKYQATAK